MNGPRTGRHPGDSRGFTVAELRVYADASRSEASASGAYGALGSRSSAAARRRINSTRGFTVAELITVAAIIGILASVAVPLANFGLRRQKEIELRERLRKITNAIDQYHDLRAQAANLPTAIKKPPDIDQGLYPKDLEELTKPIELNNTNVIRLLRERDLIDPMTRKNDWIKLGVSDDPDETNSNSDQVFEVHSRSTALALDGKTHYNEW
jgi:general secretion pathway protein G